MLRTSIFTLLTCPLVLISACGDSEQLDAAPEGVDPDEATSFRCTPVWDCVGGGQTPNSGGHSLNNLPYRPGYSGAINYKYGTADGMSDVYFDHGQCLHEGAVWPMLSWNLQPDGEIRVLLRVPSRRGYDHVWKVGDEITKDLCTWNFAVWNHDQQESVPTQMRFTDHELETVNGQTVHTYVMWTDVEPDVDGAYYNDRFYTACFDDGDYRVVGVGGRTKDARQGVSSFTAASHDGVFECVTRSPIGEAVDHMGLHLSDMDTPAKLMAVQNMMQGAGDRGYPTTDFNTYIAPVCDSGEHTTAPPATTHELEACWDADGANCKGVDYRIESESFPASFASKPSCTPTLMTAAYCCSYVLQ